ncbi:MAG: AI-2E family transporter [Bacteroidetes bacterium]|nr:AI-2E family transporter [Bacteroidota bacterium]
MAGKIKTKLTVGKTFIVLFLLLVLIAFLVMIKGYLIALVLAGLAAALLSAFHRWMTRKLKGRHRTAAVIVLVLTCLGIGLPLIGLAALVTAQAVKIGTLLAPWVTEQISSGSSIFDLIAKLPFGNQLEPYREMIIERIGQIGAGLGSFIVSSIPDITKGTVSFSLNIFIFIYSLYFFLVHGTSMVEKMHQYIPLQRTDSELILDRGITVIRASLKGILIIGFLQGFLMAIAFWIAGIQGAAFWGAIVVVLSAIPGVGAPLVWIPAVIYLITVGRIGWAIGLVIWGVLVVGLIDNILRPAVVGRDAKLPDLLILVSILGGLGLFGASGILIGPVLAAVVVTALEIYRHMFSVELEEKITEMESKKAPEKIT